MSEDQRLLHHGQAKRVYQALRMFRTIEFRNGDGESRNGTLEIFSRGTDGELVATIEFINGRPDALEYVHADGTSTNESE